MNARASIDVLLIDDSAVVRQAVKQLLEGEPDIRVRVAGDPQIADRKIQEQRPDVVILDLELPVMDGLTWLRRQMQLDPLPVIVCSAKLGEAAVPSILALEEGALEVIPKPSVGVREFLLESRRNLIRSIRAAGMATVRHAAHSSATPTSGTARAEATCRLGPVDVIAIAASTGGPQAIQAALLAMPENCPPIVVVQHMSSAFTAAFARRLDTLAPIRVREAEHAEPLLRGTALIAPGGRHLEVAAAQSEPKLYVQLHEGPPQQGHRPSADLLFRSLARSAGSRALGVLLTGMGCDGAHGLLELRRSGAITWAEDRESCVVFGMPKAAIEAGAATHVARLEDLIPDVVAHVHEREQREPGPSE